MSTPGDQLPRCVSCGRAIEACACCDERDCSQPTCDRCLTTAILKTIRRQHVHPGATLIEEVAGEPSVPA